MTKLATFAGGCFWCMQPPFDNTRGVVRTTVGYTGGAKENPTYHEVCSGKTGHTEAIEIEFDPNIVSYQDLLAIFWHNIDPTQVNGQFADHGSQYRTEIFYHDSEQQKIAEASREALSQSNEYTRPIATQISPVSKFWPAEQAHQKYYMKNGSDYTRYKIGSGRKAYVDAKKPLVI